MAGRIGKAGLPGAGRKPGVPNKVKQELRDLARQYTPEALEATVKALRCMVKVVNNPETPATTAASASAVIGNLTNILFDRGHGKPTQVLEVKRSPLDDLSPEELRALAEALDTLTDREGGPAGGDPAPSDPRPAGGVSAIH